MSTIAYLVAERRAGQWLLGDEWVQQCDTLAEAREVVAGPHTGYNVGILAVVEVDATGKLLP